ncbi:8309_t:CDS:2, partial [Rhizophagus irregularis]
ALILHSYPNDEEGKGNGNGLPNNKGSQKLKYRAQYRKGKKKLHKGELLPVKKNPRLFKGLPEKSPGSCLFLIKATHKPKRLRSVIENPGFEKFEEVSLDNKSDGKNHKKNEKKYNLDNKTVNLGKSLHKILQFIYKLPTCPPIHDKKIFFQNKSYYKSPNERFRIFIFKRLSIVNW